MLRKLSNLFYFYGGSSVTTIIKGQKIDFVKKKIYFFSFIFLHRLYQAKNGFLLIIPSLFAAAITIIFFHFGVQRIGKRQKSITPQ